MTYGGKQCIYSCSVNKTSSFIKTPIILYKRNIHTAEVSMCRQPRSIQNMIRFIILLCVLLLISCLAQDTTTIKPGRYIAELYGAHLGQYIPDDSGKYNHIHRPYDGGYGDNGIKYAHDAKGNLIPFSTKLLGPKDHLRFMLDFNFENSGRQIINFEWLRDGDANYNYKYFKENQLFMDSESEMKAKEEYSTSDDGSEQNNNDPGVHMEEEYSDQKGYNYSHNNNVDLYTDSKNLQQAVREVIYYIENNVLPAL